MYRQYVYDPHGNKISVKDSSGNAIYIINDTGFNNAYLYAGYRYDSESGLYFLNSRYYAAGIGRFLTKDTVLGDPSNPQTINLYAYCGDDPVNRVDPTGNSWEGDLLKGVFSLALGAGTIAATDGADPDAEEEITTGADEISAAVGELIDDGASDVGDTIDPVDSGTSDSGIVDDGASDAGGSVAEGTGEEATHTLYHYTNEEGMNGIRSSNTLNPSLKEVNPSDARYGNGQYMSDIIPGTKTPAQLSRAFLNNPFQGARFTHFVEINVTGLNVIEGRPGVFVIPNEEPLNLIGRFVSFGKVF